MVRQFYLMVLEGLVEQSGTCIRKTEQFLFEVINPLYNVFPLNQLITLAEFYNTSIDYILYRTDERKPYPKSIINN